MRDAFRFSIQTGLALLAVGLVSLALIWVPRLLSDDQCLRTADVECTTAGGLLQTLDAGGVAMGLVALRVVPIVLVIAIANEAVQYGTDRRRQARARRSARRASEEAGE